MSPRPAPRRAFTGRALVLAVLVIVLLVLLASPLNRFFGSRGEVQKAAQQLQQDEQQLKDLTAQQRQWSDPGFIQQQARARLQYAMPGDTVYIVVRPGHRNAIDTSAHSSTSPPPSTWNEKLWQSVQAAGR